MPKTIKAAVVQAAPVLFDTPETIAEIHHPVVGHRRAKGRHISG